MIQRLLRTAHSQNGRPQQPLDHFAQELKDASRISVILLTDAPSPRSRRYAQRQISSLTMTKDLKSMWGMAIPEIATVLATLLECSLPPAIELVLQIRMITPEVL